MDTLQRDASAQDVSQQPMFFELPSERTALLATIADLDRTPALDSVLETVEQRATLAMIEPDYIDRDFRDEYASHYATTYRLLPSRCRRLHFFSAEDEVDRYLGYCVLRPLRAHPTGRTVIAPPDQLLPYVSCICTSVVRPHGRRLRVEGFPFMEQDSQLGVCAHASVWMVALYHHLAYHTPRFVISDIASGAASHPEPLRVTPSGGLSATQVGVTLNQLGFNSIPYLLDQLPPTESISKIVCRYLNSRLPVLLATTGHVTVLVGYGRDRAGRLFYVRSDDGNGPYRVVYDTDDPLGEWNFLFVPTPGRIYLSGEVAEATARLIFQGMLRRRALASLRKRLPARLRLRTYATQAGDYKVQALERGISPAIDEKLRFVGTSNWIWIVELQDPKLAMSSRSCVLGEIAIDATCDPIDANPLFGYLLGDTYIWDDGRKRPDRTPGADASPYFSGTAIHDAPTAVLPRPSLITRARARRERLRNALSRSR
jgi:Papain-like cysteine protease AvrRpt2